MTTILQVRGMTCGHCKAAVEGALARLPGVREVRVELASGRVEVAHEASLTREALVGAVEQAGFEVGG